MKNAEEFEPIKTLQYDSSQTEGQTELVRARFLDGSSTSDQGDTHACTVYRVLERSRDND